MIPLNLCHLNSLCKAIFKEGKIESFLGNS